MEYQTSLFRGQPDTDAIRELQYYEALALESDPRGYCVCTSEGKDSRVLGHLFRRSGVKHFYVHNITGIDPPELVYFQRRNFAEYRQSGYPAFDLMYRESIWRLMRQKLIPPTRTVRYCCQELKENRHKDFEGVLYSFGVRKFESRKRALSRNELEIAVHGNRKPALILPFDNGENRRVFESCHMDREKRINPLAYWTDEMIWDYSQDANLEQCCLYAEGFQRLGCVGCPMARCAGRKKEFARWPGLARLWKKSFDAMYLLRKEKGIINLQSSGREWFEHWLSDERYEIPNEDQLRLEGGIA